MYSFYFEVGGGGGGGEGVFVHGFLADRQFNWMEKISSV